MRKGATETETIDGVVVEEGTTARPLAPEDIRPGDDVAVLHTVVEMPSYLWDVDATLRAPEELVRLFCLPCREQTMPMKVKAVCLPFVLVRDSAGEKRTLDVRRDRLARLDEGFAKKCRKSFGGSSTGE